MRLAVISSPRSGNTWLRAVLESALELTPAPVHTPFDIPRAGAVRRLLERAKSVFDGSRRRHKDAAAFPYPADNIFLQLHWYREPALQRYLDRHRFKVITLARHPLDVLVSAWRFRRFHAESRRWLGGNTELPLDRLEEPPASDFFRDYALSFGAENLLCVSYQWWHDPAVAKVRYEDIVAEGPVAFEKLCASLGCKPKGLQQAFDTFNLAYFQQLDNQHGWQGRPGLWRDLIVADDARAIFERHHRVFETLGYIIDPCPTLTRTQAHANWERLNEER